MKNIFHTCNDLPFWYVFAARNSATKSMAFIFWWNFLSCDLRLSGPFNKYKKSNKIKIKKIKNNKNYELILEQRVERVFEINILLMKIDWLP